MIILETDNKKCPTCGTWEPVALIDNYCTWCSPWDGKTVIDITGEIE